MKSSSRYFFKSDSLLCEIAFAIAVVEWTCKTYLCLINAWNEVSDEGCKLFLDIISSIKLSSLPLFIFSVIEFKSTSTKISLSKELINQVPDA